LPYHRSGQRITNPGQQDAHETTFSTEGPNICESSTWTLPPIAILAPRILRLLPDFSKICGSLDQAVSQRFLNLRRSGFNPDTVYVGQNYSTTTVTSVFFCIISFLQMFHIHSTIIPSKVISRRQILTPTRKKTVLMDSCIYPSETSVKHVGKILQATAGNKILSDHQLY
jgi:hypothetical protein